jgi:cobalt-zinc-cadmium efflux system outer membrane protein
MNKVFALFVFVYMAFGYAQENNDKIELSLNAAIDTALTNNPEVIASLKEIDAADGRILQAGRLQNAEISLEVNEIPPGDDLGQASEVDLNFSQSFEFFGKRSTRIESAELQKKIAELNYERIRKLISSQVKKVYYNGLLSYQIVESIRSNIILLNDFLSQVTDRYQAGTSSYLDVIRAKVEILKLKNELFDAMRNYQQVSGQLILLLGKNNGTEYVLSDTLNFQSPSLDGDTVINFYSSQSNFLRITEIQVEQNKSSLSLAEKNSLPDFNFGLALQNRQSTTEDGFDQRLGFNIDMTLPMFYSTGVEGDIQEAEANLFISDIRLHYAKARVSQSIKTAFSNLTFAEEQLNLFDTSLQSEIEGEMRAGVTAYQSGQIDMLNLIDIYRTYRATKIEYSRTICNTLISLTELEVAGEKEAPLNLPQGETLGINPVRD